MKRSIAWILILIVEVAYVVWGAMAGIWPDHLLGPRGIPIITAIGPFELTEYLGLALVYSALAITAPFLAGERPLRLTDTKALC